jgi:hypothetical protein
LQDEEDIVIEYVAAPAPDIEGLLQQAAPSSSKPEQQQAEDEEDDGERGFGGLGLGATPGLGLGLGFKKAEEPAEAAVDTEVRPGHKRRTYKHAAGFKQLLQVCRQ